MKYSITGSNLQIANVELDPGEELVTNAGALVYMSGNVEMESKMEGGFMSGLKRSLSGASMFLVKFKTRSGNGTVGIAGKAPGKIIDLNIAEGSWICQKSSFLGSENTVKMDIAFQKKLGSMLFGGEGLILQKLSGSGLVFAHACGDLIQRDLKAGEMLKVSTSHVVAWQDGVTYDISSVGGVKNVLFSGEGLFVTTLTGPGRVILQSMTLGDLAMSLVPYLPNNS
ncbi:MAG: TIGR00266 family protein [Candidatus Methanomethylophilaceae archaeon]|nr:TIGR00266 family protein [Candidatus Methanomethylophilaceae archaeon]